MIEVKQIGNIAEEKNFSNPQTGRVYATDGLSPTLNTCGGGQREVKIVEDFYQSRDVRVYEEEAPSLRAERSGLKIIEQQLEPAVLTPKRTEYGKAIRKAYESGAVEESRHNMTELQPRDDGVSNTLTTVQKDNLVLEKYRIRKLTPKECWRLMNFTDEDFHKAEQVNSNTQLYKQAGNSIVTSVLEAIFKQLL